MSERTLTLSSAGKSYSFTGWKVGWATGPADLVGAVLAAKQWLTFTSGAPLQPAVAHALDDEPATSRGRSPPTCRSAATCCCAGLARRRPRRACREGTYFATSDVRDLGWDDGRSFCLALPERAGVVAIPTQGFYDDQDAGRAPGPLGVLQAARGDHRGGRPAGRRRPARARLTGAFERIGPWPRPQRDPASSAGAPG